MFHFVRFIIDDMKMMNSSEIAKKNINWKQRWFLVEKKTISHVIEDMISNYAYINVLLPSR